MSREQQDKFWNELNEEKRDEYRNLYQKGLDNVRSQEGYTKGLYQGELNVMVDIFGEHNLEPEPPTPKTWEDLVEENEMIRNIYKNLEYNIHKDLPYKEHDLIRSKMLATYQIQQIIDLGYGGTMSEEEWKDPSEKYVIGCFDGKIKGATKIGHYHFIAFHTPEQRDEFMSHESNKILVKQYFMM